jgi:methylthioribose-1-phosphate isomerase
MEHVKTLEYRDNRLIILDQTLLPGQTVYLAIENVDALIEAIKRLRVRGAPAIGVSAAYGLVIAAQAAPASDSAAFMDALLRDAKKLAEARPTAVNLTWAVNRMTGVARRLAGRPVPDIVAALEAEARAIEKEDADINRAIGENLLTLLKDGDTVLTHCNAGVLATSRYGTALSPVYLARERGMEIRVIADETRPLLQGARLTAYELTQSGLDVTLICDNMAAAVMAQGRVDAVITGCDRVAANGDTANKIGTLGLSILARHFGIPMYIAAPTPTIDMDCPTGADIPIEEREALEVVCPGGVACAPEGVRVYNPAFDVTPGDHIAAIVTERGIARPPYTRSLRALMR